MTNCPPVYRNLQCESFADKKKITAQMLRQFCKNDAYLYEQIMELWDLTDPETRKRFYPTDFLDVTKSYGISESSYGKISRLGRISILSEKLEKYYCMSDVVSETYNIDFNFEDKITLDENNDYLIIDDHTIIEDSSTLKMSQYEDSNGEIKWRILPEETTEEIKVSVPYTVGTKKTTKVDKYSNKSNLDAYCDGAYHNWKANSVWYIGYNRHKNYNIKSSWRKNQDDTSIPSVCRCQTFKAKNNGLLTKVVLPMKGSKDSVSSCIVEIRTTKNGKPTSKVLARTERRFNHSKASLTNFTFDKGCVVKKGTTYAIVIRSPLSNFNKCYWISGWASTCFSNSRKRAYYEGETFLSEDNGKTWIKHGKKEKCYGSHYYDWGFAEAPVNFGFEVYIAPKDGKKTVVVDGTSTKTYSNSLFINYYAKGDYYLNFKPFKGGNYNKIQVSTTSLTGNYGTYTWQIYDPSEDVASNRWKNLADYTRADVSTPNKLVFNTPQRFIRLRLKLSLSTNIPSNTNTKTAFENILTEMASLKATATDFKKSVTDKLDFTNTLRSLDNIDITLDKSPSAQAYLRTLEYHPQRDMMLPACIWSGMNAITDVYGNGRVTYDIIKAENKVKYIQFCNITNDTILAPIIEGLGYKLGTDTVKQFLEKENGEEVLLKLSQLEAPVYILPTKLNTTSTNTYNNYEYYMRGYTKDCIVLDDYPAYPINECTYEAYNDIEVAFSKLTKVSTGVVKYTPTMKLTANDGSSIVDNITLRYKIRDSDNTISIEEVTLVPNEDYSINNDGTFSFNITGNYSSGGESKILSYFLSASGTSVAVKSDNNGFIPSESELVIETVGYDFNEWEHFIVDYETGYMKLLYPHHMPEGVMKVNYNPIWVKGLTDDTLPLKMDIWVEEFKFVKEGESDTNPSFGDKNNPLTIELSVEPLDSIRKVTLNETRELIEDVEFKVDYVNKKIKFFTTFEVNDVVTIRYTPNLTSTGLSIGYHLDRGDAFNGKSSTIQDPETVDVFKGIINTNYVAYEDLNNIYIGSNYFTTRT